MTSAILSHPLRAPPPSDTPIAISYIGPVATGQFADAQTNCQLLSMTGDATISVLSSTMSDKFGNMSIPGLAAFVKASETCKYLRDVGRHVATPIDAKVIDLSYVMSAGDQNLNRQRFVLRALQKDNGLPAGARFRLTSEPVNATPTADETPNDPFLLAYRDCRGYHDRPLVLAIAKPTVNGHLLCVEISIREMLIFFGGYSKRSAFTASRCPALGLGGWEFNPKCADSAISVWGDSSAYVSLVDEEDLNADSVNPIGVTATPKGTNNGIVMSQGRSTRGGISHLLSLDVKFRFPSSSTCLAFSDAVFTLDQPGNVAALFGCFESAATACIPSYKGAMIAAAQRLERPLRQVSRKARQDTGKVSMANVTSGRRAAVKLCDLTLQRLATEDDLMFDGAYLPGHPMYNKIKDELDEMNELLAEQGKPPVSDSRLAEPPSPSHKRVRRTYLTILE